MLAHGADEQSHNQMVKNGGDVSRTLGLEMPMNRSRLCSTAFGKHEQMLVDNEFESEGRA